MSTFQQSFEKGVRSYKQQFDERQAEYERELERLRHLQQTYQVRPQSRLWELTGNTEI